jgi:Ca2+-binding RTX toxin-like protein
MRPEPVEGRSGPPQRRNRVCDDAKAVLVGDAEGLTVLGLAGDDVIDAARLSAGAVFLTESGAAGDDILVGTPGNDTLLGGDDDDRLEGRGGTDVLDGGRGNNVIIP